MPAPTFSFSCSSVTPFSLPCSVFLSRRLPSSSACDLFRRASFFPAPRIFVYVFVSTCIPRPASCSPLLAASASSFSSRDSSFCPSSLFRSFITRYRSLHLPIASILLLLLLGLLLGLLGLLLLLLPFLPPPPRLSSAMYAREFPSERAHMSPSGFSQIYVPAYSRSLSLSLSLVSVTTAPDRPLCLRQVGLRLKL